MGLAECADKVKRNSGKRKDKLRGRKFPEVFSKTCS